MEIQIPKKFDGYLTGYGPVCYDGYSGEPIHWGYRIIRRLGDELWAELSKLGSIVHVGEPMSSEWALVTKSLTRQDAIEKYGPLAHVELGPRGGFKWIQFGQKKFCLKSLYTDANGR